VSAHARGKAKPSPKFRRLFGFSAGKGGYGVVGFTVFLLALLWAGVAYQFTHEKAAVLGDELTNTRNLTRAYAEYVDGTMRLLDQMLLRIKNDYEKNSLGQDTAQKLHVATNVDAGAVLVALTDEHGNLTAATAPLPPTARFSGDAEYFLTHARGDSGQLYISAPITGRISGKHTFIVLSRGLKKPDGTFGGIVYVSFDPQYLSGFFSDLVIGKNSSFAIVGRDMIVRDLIGRSGHATESIGKSVANSQLVPALTRASSGDYRAVAVLDGVTRLFSYRSLPDFPLVVIAGVAEADVLAGFREKQRWLVGVAVALSLIFVAFALFQLRRLTERKEHENTLSRSRESLARAQRTAMIGNFDHDLITGHAEWSDELYRLYGLSPGDVGDIGIVIPLVHPEDREKFLSIRDEINRRVPSAPVDFRIVRRDGEERILHRECDTMFDESGKPLRVFGTLQDITERKRAELEVDRIRENLARAQRIAAIGSFGRDFRTNKAEWSDEMFAIVGLGRGDVMPGSETILKLVHPDDRDRFVEYRSRELKGEPTTPIEYRIIRPDGAERIVRRESAVIFSDGDRPSRRYGTLQDVTEIRLAERRERELERHLLHSQKLEALGTLAGGIAHDLNNTLTPIMVLSKITARGLQPGDPLRKNQEIIFAASEQARDMVKRILAFSRRDKIDKKPAKLGEIVGDALKLLRATIPTSIRFDTRISEVPAILADSSQIHQVVTNLVTNAAQAIGSKMGVITVTLDRVFDSTPQRAIRLSVADTGAGMDAATRRRIFEPFFTTKDVGHGTGLGLSIVDGIVADHGGRIEVESEPGQGTRFDICFPFADAESSAAA
jgi:PAS domain S-box-containing protein